MAAARATPAGLVARALRGGSDAETASDRHLRPRVLERRARLDLATFQLPHQPEARASCGIWQWFSLGLHVTWAMFRTNDGDYVVRARWDRGEASEFIARRLQLPVSSEQMQPRVLRHTVRAPLGLVERTLASLRAHEPAVSGSSLGLDGIEYGFEVTEGDQSRRVSWREHSNTCSTSMVVASCLIEMDTLFAMPS